MSYTLVKAVILPYALASQWEEVDISKMLVKVIFVNYREISLTLLKDGAEVYVDFNQLRNEYASYNNTLPVLLIAIGNRELETMAKIPFKNFQYVKYTDSLRVGYKAMLTKRGVALPDEYPRSEKTDLAITRPDYSTDLGLVYDYCLATVNGMIHRMDTDRTNLYVVDGGKTAEMGNMGHVGLLSFIDIGKLAMFTIDSASLSPSVSSGVLYDMLSFTVDTDVTKKCIFLVLGGYLVVPEEGVFWQSSEKTYCLNLKRINYLQRILESKNFIDISSLGLTESELNPENINIAEVTSDAVIRKYFGLSQSFFVVVDRDELFFNKIFLKPSTLPGHFTAYQEPTYPLFVGFGRMIEYWKVKEGSYWSVTAQDTWYRRYSFHGETESSLVNVTNQLAFDRTSFNSEGMLLEIGASSLVE